VVAVAACGHITPDDERQTLDRLGSLSKMGVVGRSRHSVRPWFRGSLRSHLDEREAGSLDQRE